MLHFQHLVWELSLYSCTSWSCSHNLSVQPLPRLPLQKSPRIANNWKLGITNKTRSHTLPEYSIHKRILLRSHLELVLHLCAFFYKKNCINVCLGTHYPLSLFVCFGIVPRMCSVLVLCIMHILFIILKLIRMNLYRLIYRNGVQKSYLTSQFFRDLYTFWYWTINFVVISCSPSNF